MKSTWEKLDNSRAKFEVEVPAEIVNNALNRAYKKIVTKANIPGFRKGKAPRALVERFLGKETLVNEALDEILPKALGQALDESGLSPVDQPKIDLVKMEDNQPLVFTAEVEVKPEVVLGEYKGMEIPRTVPEVTEQDVDLRLSKMAEQHAQLVTHDDIAEYGHFVVIDFEGFVDGTPFANGSAEGFTLELGSGSFIPGFEDQLIGATAGEELEVKVTFPEKYKNEELAGKEAVFKVKVNEVKRKESPPIDDELAKAFGFQTVQELRSDVTNRLKIAVEQRTQSEFENQVFARLLEQTDIQVPKAMIDQRINELLGEFKNRLSTAAGMKMEQFLAMSGKKQEEVEQEFAEPATRAAKIDLILEAVAKAEGLTVTEEDIQAAIDRVVGSLDEAEQAKLNRDYLNSFFARPKLQESLLREKALHHLMSLQKPVDKPPETTETGDETAAVNNS